ncbi:uncharacterized protein LOC112271414 [Brachypodium distachyon]|uniref:uncharacterized protein LOC112271414 n=1 Tax=Brachypodium distachyon TaxID=15368 RepID=UPI000D0DB64A|nr:uncharacterized protein LOC112271414 [Brachypodium distachyon]|eukprot:XP_024316200.1 uncharacterized protein LOC112271414 [Brachypodium distachyon]
MPLAFRHPRRAANPAFSREKAAEWASQMVGPYNSVEHRAYVDTISEGGCHNVVAACFDDSVPMRPDPKFGKLIKAGERYSRLATPSMIAVGSHLRDTCGKVKPQVVLGLGVPVAPMPKIPRPLSSRKRKAPSLDLADVAESRSPLRESMDMHLAGKIDIEKICLRRLTSVQFSPRGPGFSLWWIPPRKLAARVFRCSLWLVGLSRRSFLPPVRGLGRLMLPRPSPRFRRRERCFRGPREE